MPPDLHVRDIYFSTEFESQMKREAFVERQNIGGQSTGKRFKD